MTRITDAAVEKAAWVIAEGNSRAWLTYSDGTRAGMARSWQPAARAALEAALPHLTDDGAAAPPAVPTGARTPQAPVGAGEAAERANGAANTIAVPSSHHCEGATPAIDRMDIEDAIRDEFMRFGAPEISDDARRAADAVWALLGGAS